MNLRHPSRLPDSHKVLLDITKKLKWCIISKIFKTQTLFCLNKIEKLILEDVIFSQFFRKELVQLRHAVKYFKIKSEESDIKNALFLLNEKFRLVTKYKYYILKKKQNVIEKEENVIICSGSGDNVLAGRLFTSERSVNVESKIKEQARSVHKDLIKIQKYLKTSNHIHENKVEVLEATDKLKSVVLNHKTYAPFLVQDVITLKDLVYNGRSNKKQISKLLNNLFAIIRNLKDDLHGMEKQKNFDDAIKGKIRTQVVEIMSQNKCNELDLNNTKYRMRFARQQFLVDPKDLHLINKYV